MHISFVCVGGGCDFLSIKQGEERNSESDFVEIVSNVTFPFMYMSIVRYGLF